MNKKQSKILIIIFSVLIVIMGALLAWFFLKVSPFSEKAEENAGCDSILSKEADLSEPTWQNDYIYFVREDKKNDGASTYSTWRMKADGSEQSEIYIDNGPLTSHRGIQVGAGGKSISSNDCFGEYSNMCVMDLEGNKIGEYDSELFDGPPGTSTQVTIAGDRIIYEHNGHLWMKNMDGSCAQQVTFYGMNKSPVLSPDGHKVLFLSNRDDGVTTEVYMMNIDGGDEVRLTSNNINELSPSWSEYKVGDINVDLRNSREVIENFVAAKIYGNSERISQLAVADSEGSLGASYNEKYDYEISAERELEDGRIEYDVNLVELSSGDISLSFTYILVMIGEEWKVESEKEVDIEKEDTAPPDVVKTGSVELSRADVERLQTDVDEGNELWRLDPYQVSMIDGENYGFDRSRDTFTLMSRVERGEYSGTGEATVEVKHGDDMYLIQLFQPIIQGEDGVWTINSIVKK